MLVKSIRCGIPVHILCWAVLVVALAGCASASSSAPPASPTLPQATSQPTLTATTRWVSITPSPSPTRNTPTPTLTRTRMAAVTRTPTPSQTPAFLPLPEGASLPTLFVTPAFPSTYSPPEYETPTPIATPPAGSYRLKSWSEADGLALIRHLNQTAYDVDTPSAGDFRYNFWVYQWAVNVAAREFLLRYPNSADRGQVEWMLAFTNTLDRQDSDEWLVSQIGWRLNHGWLNPADLKSGLEPLGFVAYPAPIGYDTYLFDRDRPLKPVMNLFGDNRPAYIWQIRNSEEGYYGYGMFLAVEQLPDGSFRVARIYSKHHFPFAGGPELDVRDLTGDGQPEVIVDDVGCEGGCNHLNAYIYQWQENRFTEISHGNFGSEDEDGQGDFTWEYDDNSQNGSSVINITHRGILEPVLHHSLIWNGEWFQVAGREMELSGTKYLAYDKYQDWIGTAMEYAEFDGIIEPFQLLLKNQPEDQGPAFPDFIRFQMAMAEALSSRVGPAREQLQSIVDAPADPSRPMIAAAAAAFLKEYQGDTGIFRGCQAALTVVDQYLKSLRNTYPQLDSEGIFTKLGFYSANSLCSPRAAFRLLLRSLSLKPGEDVTTRLRQAGVPVLRSLKADFDGDTLGDWLVVVDTPASERAVEAWVFVDTGQEYSAVPVFEYAAHFPGDPIGVSSSPIRVDMFPFPGDRQPAIVLQTGEQMAIFTVHHKDLTVEVELLQIINRVKSFQVDPQAYEFRVTYLPRAYDDDIYVWREGLDNFLIISQVFRLLFEQGKPTEAIRAIQTILSNLQPEVDYAPIWTSRLYYLLGLAYELQGNPSAAVETYLKVWREFPDSPYALMAREKIQ